MVLNNLKDFITIFKSNLDLKSADLSKPGLVFFVCLFLFNCQLQRAAPHSPTVSPGGSNKGTYGKHLTCLPEVLST